MRIRRIEIKHFRALKSLGPVEMRPMSVLIGENDTGKTSFLLALDIFFRVKKIENETDYFRKDTSVPVELSLTFTGISSDSHAADYKDTEGDLRVRCLYEFAENRRIEVFPRRPTEEEFLNFDQKGVGDKRAILKRLGVINGDTSPSKADCDSLFNKYLVENDSSITWQDDLPMIITEAELSRILPEFILVPVTRNLATNLGLGEKSLSGRLFRQVLRGITDEEDTQRALRDLTEKARTAVSERVTELESLLKEQTNDDTLQLGHTFEIDPLKGLSLELMLSDTMVEAIPVLNRGAGIQSSLMLAIFRLLAKYDTPDFILGIEEPENSLHPRAQREMFWVLQAIAKTSQVIFSTHSPVFVDLGLFENNIFLTRTITGETVTRAFSKDDTISLRDLLGVRPSDALLSGGGNCALIVEGETEMHLFPHLFERLDIDWRSLGIAIVPARQPDEHTIMSLVRILTSYSIPTVVLLDKDKKQVADDIGRYCLTATYQSFIAALSLSKGEIEDYFPIEVCVEVLNEMYPKGEEILVGDIDPSKNRSDELGRLAHEKKGPGARWNLGKVQFGQMIGKKIVEKSVEVDEELRKIIELLEYTVVGA